MQLMPRDDVGQRAHADCILAGDAEPRPRLFIEVAKQRQRGAANGDEVLDQIGQRTLRKRTVADVVVLFEAFEGCGVGARDAEGAVGKDALGIADVAEDFLGAPFSGE